MSSDPLAEDSIAARVLALDIDDLTLGRVKAAVHGTEFAVSVVSRDEALERVRSEGVSVILLLEWSEEGASELAHLCESMRHAARLESGGYGRGSRLHVIALGGPADHPALLRATEGPVNDALSRPFDRELLLVRLRQGVRAMRNRASALTPEEALDEALSHGSGEVCARSGDSVARIHVQDGEIVWANLSSMPATMEDVAAQGGVTLDPEIIPAVKQEGRETGAHFMDVLVKWGIIEQSRAEEAVRSFVTGRVRQILALRDATALFLPKVPSPPSSDKPRLYASRLSLAGPTESAVSREALFVPPPPPESRRVPALSHGALAGLVEAAMRTDGALGAAVLERGTGACLHHAGADFDAHVAWSQLSALAALGPTAHEVLASTEERCFVTRTLGDTPSLVLFVSFASPEINLGLARASIAMIASKTAAPAATPAEEPHGDPG